MNIVHWILLVAVSIISVAAAIHALFYKRDSKAALGWIAVSLTFPFAGPFLYFLFGINRVKTQAKRMESHWPFFFDFDPASETKEHPTPTTDKDIPQEYREMFRISEAVTKRPLVGGNRLSMYHNGEEAYPAMLKAMDQAQHSLYLSSYIFDTDETGKAFIQSLSRAVKRGVEVKVIIDGVGELYSFPWAGYLLKKNHVPFTRFLPPRLRPFNISINLRNHRKILVADSRTAFTGGMNIGDRHLVQNKDKSKSVVDMHFKLQGPITSQIEEAFLEDWYFCTNEKITPKKANLEQFGDASCRCIEDGPNLDLNKLDMILIGAVSLAHKKICIMTPYFIPSRELIGALQSASLRGVDVTIILPEKNNLPYVKWASENMLWEILQRGIKVFYQPPPFVHSKLFVVDDHYAQIGSANIDPRSLRLNFELVVEVYDTSFVSSLLEHFFRVRSKSKQIKLEDVDSRPFFVRLRDSLCWLFSPYL